MEDSTLIALNATLIGTWDSPVMILEFYGGGPETAGSGKVTSVGNQRAIDFDYQVVAGDAGKQLLTLTTTMTGAMEYEISEWGTDSLTISKKGFPDPISFVKRPSAN